MQYNPIKKSGKMEYITYMRRSSEKNMTTFGRNLWRLRQKHAMLQEDLAKAIGVPRDTISYYECKAKNPTVEFVQKIAEYFGTGTDDLLLDFPENRIKPGPKSKVEKKVEAIRKLPPNEQKAVFTLIDSLASKQAVIVK